MNDSDSVSTTFVGFSYNGYMVWCQPVYNKEEATEIWIRHTRKQIIKQIKRTLKCRIKNDKHLKYKPIKKKIKHSNRRHY